MYTVERSCGRRAQAGHDGFVHVDAYNGAIGLGSGLRGADGEIVA
jgi:hypothetical protein